MSASVWSATSESLTIARAAARSAWLIFPKRLVGSIAQPAIETEAVAASRTLLKRLLNIAASFP
ncbi:hypothetical protein D3C72_2575520 [compost metagenome]